MLSRLDGKIVRPLEPKNGRPGRYHADDRRGAVHRGREEEAGAVGQAVGGLQDPHAEEGRLAGGVPDHVSEIRG